MDGSSRKAFMGPVMNCLDRQLPVEAKPIGYAALIDALELTVPVPKTLSAIGKKHTTIKKEGWQIFGPRYEPESSLSGHLTFALKHEGVDLAVLKKVFAHCGPNPVETIVHSSRTGNYARRLWFFYEWLLGERLDLPDATSGKYTYAIDPEKQYSTPGFVSSRHRVRNNLPGTPAFCPLVFRSHKLESFHTMDLQEKAHKAVSRVPRDILARASAFLLLKDSKSSHAIEGEQPPPDRLQRWAQVIGKAGQKPIDLEELLRLQRHVIGDARFVHLGLRTDSGFVGEHDRDTRLPLPDHIDARHEDLHSLMGGLIAFERDASRKLDPVIAAAVLAFGFVYIHPFEDGNGRIHRYLIHHVLCERGFNPPDIVFPISSAILDELGAYKRALESYSRRLLPCIEWRATKAGNVEVSNETADFYRYFDATPHAEFLYECVLRTVEKDLPEEANYLQCHDEFKSRIQDLVNMPERTVDLLVRFLSQGKGHLSKRARQREFAKLTPEEIEKIESIFSEAFGLPRQEANHT